MKCPFCNEEMEQGFLQTRRIVAWVKKKHWISLYPKEGEIMLESRDLGDCLFPGWLCRSCQKVTIDYSDQDIFAK